jgi:integrase
VALYKRPGSKFYWMKFVFDSVLIQQSTKCKARRAAEMVEAAYRTQLAMGKLGIKPKKKAIPFKRAAEEYLAWEKVNHAQKPASYERVKYSTQSAIGFFGSKLVNQFESKDIENFVVHRSKQISKKTGEKITADTISLELIAIKAIFKRMISEGYLHESPASEVPLLKPNARKFHVLTLEEERLYLMACPQPLQDVAAVILETGMRPKEVYELTRGQVDLAQGFAVVIDGKNETSNRKVWLSERAAAILDARMNRFSGEYLFPKGDRDHEGPTYQLNDQHRTARKAVGLSFRLYDCRHSFATRALENGTDLLTLAHMLGHAGLGEVMRYAHPSEALKREAVKRMGRKEAKAV